MQNRLVLFILFGLLLSSSTFGVEFKPELYNSVEAKLLKITPEEFRNKKIFYQSQYIGIRKIFPKYIQDSGFKPDKYYCFEIDPGNIPVFTKKSEEYTKLLLTIKPGSTVQVYGKLKKLRYSPKKVKQDLFYLDLEKLEIISTADKKLEKATRKKLRKEKKRKNKLLL